MKNNKLSGWEIPDLIDSLNLVYLNESDKLLNFSKEFPLAAISESKDKFIIIRKFSYHKNDKKINMRNAKPDNDNGHYGMTLVTLSSLHNVTLPNNLKYFSVEFDNETIKIDTSAGITLTNFKEINSLWTLHEFSESEILSKFNALRNEVKKPIKVNKLKLKNFKTDFFGELKLDKKLDRYNTTIELRRKTISISFSNTEETIINQNIITTKQIILTISKYEKLMIKEMLQLKNDNWLEENQNKLSQSDFIKELKLYAANIYEDGNVEVYYKAGDLFWGHEIIMDIDAKGKYLDATIIG